MTMRTHLSIIQRDSSIIPLLPTPALPPIVSPSSSLQHVEPSTSNTLIPSYRKWREKRKAQHKLKEILNKTTRLPILTFPNLHNQYHQHLAATTFLENNSNIQTPHQIHLTCSICLEDYHPGDLVRLLPCTHEFHLLCIHPWLERAARGNTLTCPSCRNEWTWSELIQPLNPPNHAKSMEPNATETEVSTRWYHRWWWWRFNTTRTDPNHDEEISISSIHPAQSRESIGTTLPIVPTFPFTESNED